METKDWISTKDRLPETNNKIDNCTNCSDEVLICLNNNEVVTGKRVKELIKMDYAYNTYWVPGTYWVPSIGDYKYPNCFVTHWMEIVLPENK